MDLRTATDSEKAEIQINNILYRLHTSIPAIIISVDYDRQLLDAQIAVKLSTKESAVETPLSYSPIKKIPFLTLQGGDFLITIPPKKGDTCLLIFSERNADLFWKTGKESISTFANTRRHDINDAVAIIGFNPIANSISEYSQDSLNIRNKKNDKNISMSNDNIRIISKDNKITINDSFTELLYKNNKILLNDSGIEISNNEKKIIINDSGIEILSDNLKIKSKNIEIEAETTLALKASTINLNGDIINNEAKNQINLNGKTNIEGNTKVTGAMSVTGDFDVKLINGKPPTRNKNILEEEDATKGTLLTGILMPWTDFLNSLMSKVVAFSIKMGSETNLIRINIENDGSYEGLVEKINENIKGGNVEIKKENDSESRLLFETSEAGRELGNISYLQPVEHIQDATTGRLRTGALYTSLDDQQDDFEKFKEKLNGKGLIFKIRSGAKYVKFSIVFSRIESLLSFEDLCNLFKEENKSDLEYTLENSGITFETKGKGTFDGDISFLEKTASYETPAVLIGGFLDDFGSFIENLGDKDLILESEICGNKVVFACKNSDVIKFSNYKDLISTFFITELARVNLDDNRIKIATILEGNSATITFFKNVTTPMETNSFLSTGQLIKFEDFKDFFQNEETHEIKVKFYIKIDGSRLDYSVSGKEINDAPDYSLIADIFSVQNKEIDVSFLDTNEKLIFKSSTYGDVEISYMEFEETGGTDLDGSCLFMGNKDLGAIIIKGVKIDNPCENSADLLMMSEGKATIENGQTAEFNDDSIFILNGTHETGAEIVDAKDQEVISVNKSAVLLKGTESTGAILKKGLDQGEDPDFPDAFDGVFKLIGDLQVTNNISCLEMKIDKSLKAKGEIEFSPLLPADAGKTPEIGDVIFKGGIISEKIKTKKIEVSESGTIDELIINKKLDVNGDINIFDGDIKSSGNTLSFEGDGIHSSKDFHAPDVYVND